MLNELIPFTVQGETGTLAGWNTDRELVGASPPVLFIHPINTQGLIWKRVVETISEQRYCILPDLRGHGRSTPEGPFGLNEWVDDLVACIRRAELAEFHVVGGSLGGALACALAERLPDSVKSVSALGSSLNFEGVELGSVIQLLHELGVEGMFRKVFPEITFGPKCDPSIIEEAVQLSNPNDVNTVSQIWEATIAVDATANARRVSCPSMIITGEHDVTCPLNLAMEMARVLGTNLVLIPDIGHMPMLEAPNTVTELLVRHFSETD